MKPSKGDALLFFSTHPDATTDPNSLHGACPVEKGEKWSAPKWLHVAEFDRPIVSEKARFIVRNGPVIARSAMQTEHRPVVFEVTFQRTSKANGVSKKGEGRVWIGCRLQPMGGYPISTHSCVA